MASGMTPFTAALAFSDEAYQTSGPRLMGAMSASEGFLRAYLKYSGAEKLFCYTASDAHFKTFIARVEALGGKLSCERVSPLEIDKLAAPGTLYFPDPSITDAAWQRRRAGDTAFSITGVTHTTCSDPFMDLVGSWSIAPVQTWDALICTSQSVHSTLTQVIERYEEYLRERLGATAFTRPQLPVIPLGVDIDSLSSNAQAESFRRLQRAALGIGASDIAFLFLGRLSYHAKAHPLPMYLALEQAALRTGKRVHLILAGWFANEALERTFLQGAAQHCPSVNVRHVDGRRADVRQQIWFAADVFTSLSDNIQETFGLTPIEAMAAGLPLVISDWDGYRDTVQHGVQGFLVPTTMPPPGSGEEIAVRWAARADSYDRYIAHQSQCTAVDVAACADFYVRLIESPALRKQLGDAGRERARSVFSWQGVIHAYQALWAELAERRLHAPSAGRKRQPWHPLRRDPLELFASYATRALTDDVVIRMVSAPAATQLPGFYRDPLANYAGGPFVLATLDECRALLALLSPEARTVADITCAFPPPRKAAIVRTLGWLLKCGLVEVDATTKETKSTKEG
jgi:glycosyltransferase involved in cell wall biosynthesis